MGRSINKFQIFVIAALISVVKLQPAQAEVAQAEVAQAEVAQAEVAQAEVAQAGWCGIAPRGMTQSQSYKRTTLDPKANLFVGANESASLKLCNGQRGQRSEFQRKVTRVGNRVGNSFSWTNFPSTPEMRLRLRLTNASGEVLGDFPIKGNGNIFFPQKEKIFFNITYYQSSLLD